MADKLMGKEDIRALIEELRSGEDVCDEDLKTAQGWEDALDQVLDYCEDPIFVREDHFEEFAQSLVADLGPTEGWPYDCIDWAKAAESLRQGYREFWIDCETYLVRA